MKKIILRTIVTLTMLCLILASYIFYIRLSEGSIGAMSFSIIDFSSTKEWQDTASIYINKRNDIINNAIDGKYGNDKRWVWHLKSIECPPLLDGDIALMNYILKNHSKFKGRVENIKIEYSSITKLTKDEVKMAARISCTEDSIPRNFDCEIVFKKLKGKWLMSKYSFV